MSGFGCKQELRDELANSGWVSLYYIQWLPHLGNRCPTIVIMNRQTRIYIQGGGLLIDEQLKGQREPAGGSKGEGRKDSTA